MVRIPENLRGDGETATGIGTGDLLNDQFEVGDLLGAGGMGAVYRARDVLLDRTVAVKVLPAFLGTSKRAREGLRREAARAIELAHPALARVYQFGIHYDQPYLVMEYIEGPTLADRLDEGPLPLAEALPVLAALAAGVDHAHSKRLVHRDIKPSNVLLRAPGGEPVLIDFGIAGEARDQATRSGLTGQANTTGTLSYMSPEQVRGKPPAPPMDLYALAALAYEMLGGDPPFFRGDPMAVQYQIIHEPPEALEGQPAGVNAALLRGLAKKPGDRFGDAAGFVAALGAGDAGPTNPKAADRAADTLATPAQPGEPAPAGEGGNAKAGAETLVAPVPPTPATGGDLQVPVPPPPPRKPSPKPPTPTPKPPPAPVTPDPVSPKPAVPAPPAPLPRLLLSLALGGLEGAVCGAAGTALWIWGFEMSIGVEPLASWSTSVPGRFVLFLIPPMVVAIPIAAAVSAWVSIQADRRFPGAGGAGSLGTAAGVIFGVFGAGVFLGEPRDVPAVIACGLAASALTGLGGLYAVDDKTHRDFSAPGGLLWHLSRALFALIPGAALLIAAVWLAHGAELPATLAQLTVSLDPAETGWGMGAPGAHLTFWTLVVAPAFGAAAAGGAIIERRYPGGAKQYVAGLVGGLLGGLWCLERAGFLPSFADEQLPLPPFELGVVAGVLVATTGVVWVNRRHLWPAGSPAWLTWVTCAVARVPADVLFLLVLGEVSALAPEVGRPPGGYALAGIWFAGHALVVSGMLWQLLAPPPGDPADYDQPIAGSVLVTPLLLWAMLEAVPLSTSTALTEPTRRVVGEFIGGADPILNWNAWLAGQPAELMTGLSGWAQLGALSLLLALPMAAAVPWYLGWYRARLAAGDSGGATAGTP